MKNIKNRAKNKETLEEKTKKWYMGGDEEKNDVRIIAKNWIVLYCQRELKQQLYHHSNEVVILKNEIISEIRTKVGIYTSKNVSYIHKYIDPITQDAKFCRAELDDSKKKKAEYNLVYRDIITHEFLLDLVALNDVHDFYRELMNPKYLTKTFRVPETSVKDLSITPSKHEKAPVVEYQQFNTGLCGICALASALHFNYGIKIASFVYNFQGEYHKHFINESKSKKNPIMSFLKSILYRKKREYRVEYCSGNSISLSNMMKDQIYYKVVVGLLKDSLGSKDHIISFCQGWIFDSNLPYAIAISDVNLDWCCGNHVNEAMFDGFHELFIVEKN